jgi:hypothetical protein
MVTNSILGDPIALSFQGRDNLIHYPLRIANVKRLTGWSDHWWSLEMQDRGFYLVGSF